MQGEISWNVLGQSEIASLSVRDSFFGQSEAVSSVSQRLFLRSVRGCFFGQSAALSSSERTTRCGNGILIPSFRNSLIIFSRIRKDMPLLLAMFAV